MSDDVTRADSMPLTRLVELQAAEIAALRERAEAAEAERQRIAHQHAEYVAGRVTLSGVSFRDGRMDMTLHTDMAAIVADSLAAMLDDQKAENYVEVAMRASDGKAYSVLVRRYEKPTPHDLRMKAEAERDAARKALAIVGESLREWKERWEGGDEYPLDIVKALNTIDAACAAEGGTPDA